VALPHTRGALGRDREVYYLTEQPGYNLIHVNKGILTHSPETRAKISSAMMGENNPFFGETHTDESKAQMSAAKMGVKRKPKSDGENELVPTIKAKKGVPVSLFSSDTKELLNTFDSTNHAARHFDCDKTTIKRYSRNGKIFLTKYILSLNKELGS
jgi:group I intron endonuclease